MLPRLKHPVSITVRPLNHTATTIDPTFRIPVDQAGNPAAATYGDPITIRAQVTFHGYKVHQVQPEGDRPATSGQLTILAVDVPVADLQDARVESVAGEQVSLIMKELKPGAWAPSGRPALYRADLQEANHLDAR